MATRKKVSAKMRKQMLTSDPVYIKLEYHESLESKKDILSSELDLLNILKIIRRYSLLKKEEIKIKSNLYKKIRELDLSLKKTKTAFPFIKIPKHIKRDELKGEIKIERTHTDEEIERQLMEIQERLRLLENKH